MPDKSVSFVVTIKDAGSATLKTISGAATEVTAKLFNFKDILHGILDVAAGFSLAEIIKDIVELGTASDTAFRQIAANLPTFTEGIDELKDHVADLASVSGRSLESMEQSAANIAKLGVSSAEELRQELEAATLLADGTGQSVDDSAQLLLLLRRELGLTGDQAIDTAAKLASIAKGKIPIEELFNVFSAASPRFHALGIDANTALAAISALVDPAKGAVATSRELRARLNDLSAGDLKLLASQSSIAADALEQLNRSAQHVRDGIEQTDERIKNKFSKSLSDLGQVVLPPVLAQLSDFLDALTKISQLADRSDESKLRTLFALMTGNPATIAASFADLATGSAKPPALPAGFQSAIPKSALTGGGFNNPLGVKATKEIDDLRAKLAELMTTEETAKSKSDQFTDSMGKWLDEAAASKMGADEYSKALASLNGHLAELRQQEAVDALAKQAKTWAEQAKATSDAFGALSGELAKFTGGSLTEFDAETNRILKGLDDLRSKLKEPDLPEFDRGVSALRDKFAALRVAIAETVDTEKELGVARDLIQSQTATTQQLSDEIGRLTGLWDNAEKKSKAATDPKVAEQYKKEAQEILQVIQQLNGSWDQVGASSAQAADNLDRMIEKLAQVADAAVGAANQLGLMDARTAQGLEGGINIGAGIATGNPLQIISGVAELGKSLFGLGQNSAAARQRAIELQDSIKQLFTGLQTEMSATGGNSLAERIAAAQAEYENARNQIENNEGGKKNQTQREKDLDKLNVLEAQRVQQLEAEYEEQQKEAQQDLQVRLLNAQGKTAGAAADAFAEQQAREYAQAVKDGADEATLAALTQTQLAEAEQFAAEQATKAAEAAIDAANKQAALNAKVFGENADQQFQDKAGLYSALPGVKALFDGLDLTTQEGLGTFKKRLQDFLKGIEDGSVVLDTSVFSIDDFMAAIGDLSDAADSAASTFESAAQKISDAENQIAIGDDILGTSGPSSIAEYASAYGIDLSAFDLTNQAGVGGAIGYIQDLFKGLDPNDPDFALKEHEYQSLVDKLRPLISSGNAGGASMAGIPSTDSYNQSATGSVTAISSAEAGGIIGELQTANAFLGALPDIRDLLTKWINPGLGSLPSYSRGGVGSPVGGTFAGGAQPLEVIAVVQLDGKEIAFAVAKAMLDPQVGQQIGRSLTRTSDRASSGIGLPRSG